MQVARRQRTAGSRRWAAKARRLLPSGLLPAACCLLVGGCMGLTGSRTPPAPKPALTPTEGTPTAADLVGYLNRTAAGITALESRDLDLDVQSGKQSFGLSGTLFC